MLISIEGIDGVGKTTLAKALAERLGATYLKFPDRTTATGKMIDDVLRGRAALPPLTFQALQVCNRLEKWMTLHGAWRGGYPARLGETHVVCDRYTLSGYVYGAQDGLALEEMRAFMDALPNPDITILLLKNCAAVDGERLAGRDREIYESRGVEGLVDQTSKFLLYAPSGTICIDTGNKEVSEVLEIALKAINERLSHV